MVPKTFKIVIIGLLIAIGMPNVVYGETDTTKWALTRISVAHVRVKPGHASELSSQTLMGMPVKLLEKKGDWWHVETHEGYKGYIIDNSLTIKTPDEMHNWRASNRVIVISKHQTYIYKPNSQYGFRDIVSDVVNGVILYGKKSNTEFTEVALPDGRLGIIKTSDIASIEEWAKQPYNPNLILDMAYSMHGLPYLWGGTSTKSLDCSGLAKVCYFANGIILRRDAYQQAETGLKLAPEDWKNYETGDLLFFGNPKTKRVTHVAIYNADGVYIHASGRVKINSIDPQSEMYLKTPFFHACRINGAIGTDGIVQAINHPWYFNK